MPKFTVDIEQLIHESTTVTVEADNESQARERAYDECDEVEKWDFDGVADRWIDSIAQHKEQSPETEPHILLCGSLSDGYHAVGPFASFEEACEYDDRRTAFLLPAWIMSLQTPKD